MRPQRRSAAPHSAAQRRTAPHHVFAAACHATRHATCHTRRDMPRAMPADACGVRACARPFSQHAAVLAIASDGVWDAVTPEQTADIIAKCANPTAAARAMVSGARSPRHPRDERGAARARRRGGAARWCGAVMRRVVHGHGTWAHVVRLVRRCAAPRAPGAPDARSPPKPPLVARSSQPRSRRAASETTPRASSSARYAASGRRRRSFECDGCRAGARWAAAISRCAVFATPLRRAARRTCLAAPLA
eukprot:2035991-Prymnesium_polylepis.1